jgi:hypothetical protein
MVIIIALQPFSLPPLPLIATQIVDIKGPVGLAVCLEFSLQFDEPFAAGVDSESAQVAHDPATVQALGHCARGARATEEIGHEVALVGGGADDALQESLGLLGIVTQALNRLRVPKLLI